MLSPFYLVEDSRIHSFVLKSAVQDNEAFCGGSPIFYVVVVALQNTFESMPWACLALMITTKAFQEINDMFLLWFFVIKTIRCFCQMLSENSVVFCDSDKVPHHFVTESLH